MDAPDSELLRDLLGRKPSLIELDRAALEIARLEYPELDAGTAVSTLDNWAWMIADRAHDLSDGERFVETANAFFFEELGLRGNDEDYYNPDNSYLHRVIETKLGIPITMSLIYIEVARRLAKPVFGIGLPGHFLVRYDDGDYSTYIDPYNGGTLLDVAGCCHLAQVEVLEAEHLEPADKRSIAMRMINNLRQIYFSRRDSPRALRLLDLLIEADPTRAEEHKQRGVALLQMKLIPAALAAFRQYMELLPNAPDREQIQEQIRNLSFWLASQN